MKFLKKIVKYLIFLLGIILLYLSVTILLSYFTVNKNVKNTTYNKSIYLSTNGVHLSIIFPKNLLNSKVLKGLKYQPNHNYFMFGWGNEDFYINTPTWGDLKFKYAFGALFLDTPTAIHITTFKNKHSKWIEVKCNQQQLEKLNLYILNSFKLSSEGKKQHISQSLYGENHNFYKATGNYSVMKTCNTWANNAFKESGLKASYFTLFDFGLINKYE